MNRYSQNDEQDVILRYFGDRRGMFLDIGAYDGVTFSNTRALLELGWSGVLVEPDPRNVVKLLANTRPFAERARIIAAAVSPSTMPAMLRMDEAEDRGWASTIVTTNAGVLRPSPMQLIVPTIPPTDLLNFGQFDFINIDAEHMDFSILLKLRSDLGKCSLLCIEPSDQNVREKMKDYLCQRGFKTLHETPENIIAIRNP